MTEFRQEILQIAETTKSTHITHLAFEGELSWEEMLNDAPFDKRIQPSPAKMQQNEAKHYELLLAPSRQQTSCILYSVLLLRRTEIEWRDDTKKLYHTPEPYKLLSHSEVSFRRILGPKMRGQVGKSPRSVLYIIIVVSSSLVKDNKYSFIEGNQQSKRSKATCLYDTNQWLIVC